MAEAAIIAGTLISAAGAIQQGNAAKAAGDFNAAVANNNATLARQSAEENARRQERSGRKRQGLIRAQSGASGAGQALDVLADSAAEEELSRLTTLHQGDIEAIGFQNTANLERFRGKAAKRAGQFKAASQILSLGYDFAGGGSSASMSGPNSAGTSPSLRNIG